MLIDTFNLYTREAGAGNLSIGVDGPSKADIQLNDTGTGFIVVSFKVQQPGNFCLTFCNPLDSDSIMSTEFS